jgi:hypothetical protein
MEQSVSYVQVSAASVPASAPIFNAASDKSTDLSRGSTIFSDDILVNLDLIGPVSPLIVPEPTWKKKLKANHHFK